MRESRQKSRPVEEQEEHPAFESPWSHHPDFNPALDSFEGRSKAINRMIRYALSLPDDCVPVLQKRVEIGNRAAGDFLAAHDKLAAAVAVQNGYLASSLRTHYILDLAREGLRIAMEGFDPGRPGEFSSYAYPCMQSVIYKGKVRHLSDQLGISCERVETLVQALTIRTRMSGAGQSPSLEAIAKVAYRTIISARLANRQVRPTEAKIDAAWQKLKPRYLRQLNEDIARWEALQQIQRTNDLDASVKEHSDTAVGDLVADRTDSLLQPEAGAMASVRNEALIQALKQSGLDDIEQYIVMHYHGIFGSEQLTKLQIAERLPAAQAAPDPERFILEKLNSAMNKLKEMTGMLEGLL